jgi:hypothetical protein
MNIGPTKPSRGVRPSNTPRGTKKTIKPQDDEATRDALQAENESAEVLAKHGYDIEQSPAPPPGSRKRPDYKIEGEYFDCYAPRGSNARNIWSNVKDDKVDAAQADRIVLNLNNSNVDMGRLKDQFNNWPMPGLKEVIVVKGQSAIPFFP